MLYLLIITRAYFIPHYSTTTEWFELKNKYPMQVQKSHFRDQGIVNIRVSISANCLATLAVSYKLQPIQCFWVTWISSAGIPDSGTQSPTKSLSFRSGDTSRTKVVSGRSLGAQKTVTSIVFYGENHWTNPLPHNTNKLVPCPTEGKKITLLF